MVQQNRETKSKEGKNRETKNKGGKSKETVVQKYNIITLCVREVLQC